MSGQFAAVEKSVQAHVLMGGFGHRARVEQRAAKRRIPPLVTPLDGIRYARAASPSAILFQWAGRDGVLTAEDLEIFFNAAK